MATGLRRKGGQEAVWGVGGGADSCVVNGNCGLPASVTVTDETRLPPPPDCNNKRRCPFKSAAKQLVSAQFASLCALPASFG